MKLFSYTHVECYSFVFRIINKPLFTSVEVIKILVLRNSLYGILYLSFQSKT